MYIKKYIKIIFFGVLFIIFSFAYFSVTVNQSDNKTVITGKAEKVGTVTVNGSKNTYALEVTAVDMIAQGQDKSYHAIQDGGEPSSESTSGGKWVTSAQKLEAGTITLTGAEDSDTVKCQVSVKVDLAGTMVGHLQIGDMFLTLEGLDGMFDGVSNQDLKDELPSKFTYNGSGDNATASATFTGTGTLDLTMAASTKKLTADVWLVNKQATDQSALAGKTLTVTLTLQTSNCKTEKTSTD